jgi:hypothetical protein
MTPKQLQKLIIDLRCMRGDCIDIKDDSHAWDLADEDNWDAFIDILTRTLDYLEEESSND